MSLRVRTTVDEPVTIFSPVQQFQQRIWNLGSEKMRRQFRRVAGVVAIVPFTSILTLYTTGVRKHHHPLEEEHHLGVKETALRLR